MKPISLKTTFVAGLGMLPLAPAPTLAETVLIDWSTATSITNPAGDGKYWNSLGANGIGSDVTTTTLVDSNNAPSGISVAVNNTGNSSNNTGAGFGGNGINGPAGADPFDEAGAVIDGIYSNYNANGTSVITFTGLAASTQYDFSAIGGRASNGNDGIITVNTGTSGATTYSLLNNGTVLNFSVTSTAGGVIEFDFRESVDDTNGGTSATWNAMSITGNPAGPDEDPPTLAGSDIVDDRSGGPVAVDTPITYTLTFSEDMDHLTFNPTDFWDAGSDVSLSFLSITETSPGVFEVVVTPDNAGTLEFQVNAGATLDDAAGNPLNTTAAIVDDTAITVSDDTTPPTLLPASIEDDQSGGPVAVGTPITYTLTFSEDMDHTTFNPTDFWDAGSDVSFGFLSITETSPGVFEVVVTPDNAGTLEFQVNAGATLNDVAGNPLNTTTAIVDDTAITVTSADTTSPTLAGSDIVDDQSGGPVAVGTPITYTLTFSEDMDHTTFNPTDFWDAGSDVSFGFLSITETSPGVFEVVVTPDNAGTLEFQVNAGATLNDAAGNPLDTTAAIVDDTAITVNAAPGGITGGRLWTEWYRPVDSPVFSISDGNNHDPIIFYEPSGSTYKYYLIISHETSNAFLWGANSFSWDSADWTLINGNYQISGQYEYDDAVKVGGTYYLYEDGKVLTYTGDLANSNGNWTQAGTFPKSQCDDIGVFHENGVFHIFGENGVYPDGFDGLRLSHYTSTTGVGDWTLVDTHAVDPNPDGGTTYGVGDATIAKVDGIYYLFCDRESVGSPYRVTAWASTDLGEPFTYLGIAFEPREGETDDWDNHRVQDADIQYIPELKRFIMVCNMMDTDGVNPDGVPAFLPNNSTRVVGTFYSKVTDGGFDSFMEGFSGLAGGDGLVDADPDGDGATNGEEYAGGTLPDDPSSFPLYEFSVVEDGGVHYPAIVFDRITVDPLTTRNGEVSNAGSLAPGAFSPTDGVESATGISGAGAWYEQVIYRSTTPVSSSTSQFLRARTTIAPPP